MGTRTFRERNDGGDSKGSEGGEGRDIRIIVSLACLSRVTEESSTIHGFVFVRRPIVLVAMDTEDDTDAAAAAGDSCFGT